MDDAQAQTLKLAPGNLPTMATDGARIVYNPSFVDQLTPAELEGTLAHEVMHCALGHQCRRGGRDSELWNRAAGRERQSISQGQAGG